MSPHPDAPLRKVTLNLNEADCAYLQAIIGDGWTVKIRDIIAEHVRSHRIISVPPRKGRPRTLGDLDETQR